MKETERIRNSTTTNNDNINNKDYSDEIDIAKVKDSLSYETLMSLMIER